MAHKREAVHPTTFANRFCLCEAPYTEAIQRGAGQNQIRFMSSGFRYFKKLLRVSGIVIKHDSRWSKMRNEILAENAL